ncbi:hypothetical protein GOODEAATRI_020176 [Goodea atripinnis]|uniref:Uncharacterized protein n=1 Tax=Goodea atripinnis TaxID=208336 RepID=A0ABV0NLT5_9TELE
MHREDHLIQILQVTAGTRRSSRYQITRHLSTLCSLSRLNVLVLPSGRRAGLPTLTPRDPDYSPLTITRYH